MQSLTQLQQFAKTDLQQLLYTFRPANWTIDNKIANEKGSPMSFDDRKYLIDIYNDLSPEQVFQKGAQMGITTLVAVKNIWKADTDNISSIFTMPTDSEVRIFSQMRLKSIINSCERLKREFDDVDNVSVKRLKNSSLYFKGTWSESQAISVPSDLNIHDELDFSRPNVIELYEERLTASKLKWKWLLSTPTIPDYGINEYFKRSTQKHWLVNCPACNKQTDIDFFKDIKKDDAGRHYYACRHCGKELEDRNSGQWIEMNPGAKIVGYWIPQTIAQWISADTLIEKYERAKKRGKEKEFFNFNLGLPFSQGLAVLNRELILRQVKDYRLGAGSGCVMGVDQGDLLHVEIRQPESILSGGKIVYIGIVDSFEKLDELMKLYGISVCVIDALPNKHSARQFRDRFPGRVFLSYYNERDNADSFEESKKDPGALLLDRNDTLDNSANVWINGDIALPAYSGLTEIFIEHMSNMAKVETVNKYGQKKYSWEKTGEDHFRHADNYCNVALSKLQMPTVKARFL
jgi:hypothetical protein